jgi:hypothetical protein
MSTKVILNTISDEVFAAVIDGVATSKERRFVYMATKDNDELKQMFNELLYAKMFEKEIETDFQTRYAGRTFELGFEPEKPDQSTLFNDISLSVNNFTIDLDHLGKDIER